jgi:hypothetical protein
VYFSVYFWYRVVFVHAVPCAALVLLNARLAGAMREARRRRSRMVKQHRMTESCRLRDANATTLMLLVVVGLFLIVELPTGVNLVMLILENNSGRELMDLRTRALFELFTNLLIVFSYPLNFFIYCTMSRQFRQTFRAMFTRDCCCLVRQSISSPDQSSASTAAASGLLGAGTALAVRTNGVTQSQTGLASTVTEIVATASFYASPLDGGSSGGVASPEYDSLLQQQHPLLASPGNGGDAVAHVTTFQAEPSPTEVRLANVTGMLDLSDDSR